MMNSVSVISVRGLPLIKKGDDIAKLVIDACPLQDGDIICIASTIISKAKGYSHKLSEITPGSEAIRIAEKTGEDPKFMQVVLNAAKDVVLEAPFTLTELKCGHIGVRSGVDASNVENGMIITLPEDPMKEAEEFKTAFESVISGRVGVIITDTCGRAFRRGQTGHAIGWSGLHAIRDFRGDTDLFGKVLEITEEAVIDEIAGFSNVLMGESNNGVPVVVFRGIEPYTGHDSLYFNSSEDIFRKALKQKR